MRTQDGYDWPNPHPGEQQQLPQSAADATAIALAHFNATGQPLSPQQAFNAWLEERTSARMRRGVEGTHNA